MVDSSIDTVPHYIHRINIGATVRYATPNCSHNKNKNKNKNKEQEQEPLYGTDLKKNQEKDTHTYLYRFCIVSAPCNKKRKQAAQE
mmetsp:Transcript_5452/g.11964  ORF Transcript_5452/g.11964 Transcript_5452/m.11964 type:complete len:86 (-) Transcript_5452:160-417(-)